MHLKQPGFTYSACGAFTKKKQRIKKETGDTKYIYRNKLDEASFQHDMAYGKYKDLNKRTQSDKFLRDKAFEIASNLNYDGYQRALASMVYKCFDKEPNGSGVMPNQHLANDLHKPIIRKFKRRKVYSSFKYNIRGVDLADIQLISKYNKGMKYLSGVIDILNKFAWVVPLKDKKGVTINNAFQKILGSSKRKPNKIWVDQGSEFHNSPFKKQSDDNDIKMYSTHNEVKFVVAERFIRTLENKIYKHMAAVSKKILFILMRQTIFLINTATHSMELLK